MTKLLIITFFLTLFLSCNAQTEKPNETNTNTGEKSIYYLDNKTRKEMTDSLVKFLKQHGDSEAEKKAEAFVNKYEKLQIEQQDSIKFMSDIYVEFKHSKPKTNEQKPAEIQKNEPK